ncbi:hypothetical protein SNOG_13700 [Parastagonospora nodorum SN15]|uniref:Uncharacterized protein n=1 Tax=Phaeosphaeria nodorum (strain SN15 / ATCC MYA-4574 / FGSC 10173) TaxID=321614 RepID=Q0U3G4_PHANO|nr:hypothetical protein SNOG_13700 [Parastagonospora nodorum SN15]EAT78724.2 hypothetical protein SNOG_13700 [Parastagonospora nodorum SN15]
MPRWKSKAPCVLFHHHGTALKPCTRWNAVPSSPCRWLFITHSSRVKNAGDWVRYNVAGIPKLGDGQRSEWALPDSYTH